MTADIDARVRARLSAYLDADEVDAVLLAVQGTLELDRMPLAQKKRIAYLLGCMGNAHSQCHMQALMTEAERTQVSAVVLRAWRRSVSEVETEEQMRALLAKPYVGLQHFDDICTIRCMIWTRYDHILRQDREDVRSACGREGNCDEHDWVCNACVYTVIERALDACERNALPALVITNVLLKLLS